MSLDPTGLSQAQRLNMVNLVCSFAWTDFDLDDDERAHIRALCRQLNLDAARREQVEAWLDQPPDTDEMADPGAIPIAHREAFLEECQRIILADAYVDAEESLAYRIFRDILLSERRDDD